MRKIINNLKFIFISFFRLFFDYLNGGSDCVICGRTTYGYPVCKECVKNHFTVDSLSFSSRCRICGRELVCMNNICFKCRQRAVFKSTDCVIPLFSYRLWNKELIFLWKMEEIRSLSFFFASLVNKGLKFLDCKIIIPVPPRKGKIKEKGWDQIDELCSILSCKYGYIVLNLLQRLSTEEQKKLGREERLNTIKDAYRLADERIIKKELKKLGGKLPEKICLIDDVCTTGATVECCCEKLRRLNIKSINVLTLFNVD